MHSLSVSHKYFAVCHASINAILNKNAESLEGCVLYTTLFPGHEDAKIIIQAGITEVIYYEDKYPDHEFTFIAKKLFDKAGVDYKRYQYVDLCIVYYNNYIIVTITVAIIRFERTHVKLHSNL